MAERKISQMKRSKQDEEFEAILRKLSKDQKLKRAEEVKNQSAA